MHSKDREELNISFGSSTVLYRSGRFKKETVSFEDCEIVMSNRGKAFYPSTNLYRFNATGIDPDCGNFSVWIYPDSYVTGDFYIFYYYADNNNYLKLFYDYSEGKVVFTRVANGNTLSVEKAVTMDGWVYIAISWDTGGNIDGGSNTLRIYVSDEYSGTDTSISGFIGSASYFYVGSDGSDYSSIIISGAIIDSITWYTTISNATGAGKDNSQSIEFNYNSGDGNDPESTADTVWLFGG
jgi:hypothetical protein